MVDPGLASIIVVMLVLFCLAVGVHIGVALGLGAIVGIYLVLGQQAALGHIATAPFRVTANFTLAVVPLFVLMGALANHAGLTKDLYRAAYNWLGHLRGGLAIATTFAATVFGAICASTVVSAAVFTKIAMPEMTKFGYNKRLIAGCIAASGTIASLIPPSIVMVVYGILTEQSIGKLLIAGFLPGILTATTFIISIYLRVRHNPQLAPVPDIHIPWRTKFRSLYGVWGIVLLFLLVMGGIYTGLFTPTYAGGVGAFGAFLIIVGKRRLNRDTFMSAIKDSAVTTCAIFIIVIGGILFSRYLSVTGIVGNVSNTILSVGLPRFVYFLGYVVIYLILGMFIEPISIMVITLPMMFPIMVGAGFDPIWLGVISVKLAEIGLITPPVGLNVYVVKSASPTPLSLEDVFIGIMPFLLVEFVNLTILIIFPQISLVLPNLMY